VTTGSRFTMKQQIVTAVCCAAILGGVSAPANAADLRAAPHAKHVRISHSYGNWRDRCAHAGYYCLYAEYGYVYAYPFDDRPIAHSGYRRVRAARR
jgi:hypothetical protein